MKKTIIAAFTLAVSCGVAQATTFDLATDYSTPNGNPNGTWTYGWFLNTIPGGAGMSLLDLDGDEKKFYRVRSAP